jgi:hypothetical protein
LSLENQNRLPDFGQPVNSGRLLPNEETTGWNQDCGTSSIALISGFSTLLVKVMVNFPLVTSTGTVST